MFIIVHELVFLSVCFRTSHYSPMESIHRFESERYLYRKFREVFRALVPVDFWTPFLEVSLLCHVSDPSLFDPPTPYGSSGHIGLDSVFDSVFLFGPGVNHSDQSNSTPQTHSTTHTPFGVDQNSFHCARPSTFLVGPTTVFLSDIVLSSPSSF